MCNSKMRVSLFAGVCYNIKWKTACLVLISRVNVSVIEPLSFNNWYKNKHAEQRSYWIDE